VRAKAGGAVVEAGAYEREASETRRRDTRGVVTDAPTGSGYDSEAATQRGTSIETAQAGATRVMKRNPVTPDSQRRGLSSVAE